MKYIIKMKAKILLLITAGVISVSNALDLFGFKVPEVEQLNPTQERAPGMPFVHDHPRKLLGIYHSMTNLFLGCEQTSDDEAHPCHHKNIALMATHAGRVKTDLPIYGVLT